VNEEMFNSILELVRQGGAAAVWVYAVHMGVGVLKFIVGFGCLYACIVKICKTARWIHDEKSSITNN
jgi:hypothetical protein